MRGKKKTIGSQQQESASKKQGKPLIVFFAPVLALMLGLLGILAYIAVWQEWNRDESQNDALVQVGAQNLALYLEQVIEARKAQLRLLVSQLPLLQALHDERQRQDMEEQMQALLPGVMNVRLLPAKGWSEDRVQKALFGSFAALDAFQAILPTHQPAPVMALKNEHGKPYFLIMQPLLEGRLLKGVVAAQYDLQPVLDKVGKAELNEQGILLKQQGDLQLLALGVHEIHIRGQIPVTGTLWAVQYGTIPRQGLELWSMKNAAVLVALVALFALLWAYQRLQASLAKDAALLLGLAEAIREQKGSKTLNPHLAPCAKPIQALVGVAQMGLALASRDKAKENKAGQAQLQVTDLEKEEQQSAAQVSIDPEEVPHSIFHNGYMRWRIDAMPNQAIIQAAGQALGTMLQHTGGDLIWVARDQAASSDRIGSMLVSGILASGCDVMDLGVAPLPVVVLAALDRPRSAGIMITGGHDGQMFAGMKIIFNDQYMPATQMAELRKSILLGDFSVGNGQLEQQNYVDEYLAAIMGDVQLVESFKIVVDCGNGVTGALMERLFNALECEVILIDCEPTETPSNYLSSSRLEALGREVVERGADLGVSLALDGDAMMLVDEKGQSVAPDLVLMLLAGDIIKRNPGADILYDTACSASLAGRILAEGGRPIMWQSGAAKMQQKLLETDGLLAGEFSGHFYIRERWNGFDDALYALARLLEYLALEGVSLSQACQGLSHYVATPRLMAPTDEGEAEAIVLALREQEKFADANLVEIDGLRAEYANAWGMVRPSHSRPALIFRFEGDDEEALEDVQEKFRQALRELAPALELPF